MSYLLRWTRRTNGYRWFLRGAISVLNKINQHTGVRTRVAQQALWDVDAQIARQQGKRHAK